jgi:hypothetical protein
MLWRDPFGERSAMPETPVHTDRPRMFGKDEMDPALLPWTRAEHRLLHARAYWIATTRRDGRPHGRPVGGIWRPGAFHVTGSLAGGNLARSPFEPRPAVAFGWVSDNSGLDGGAAFAGATTRRRFTGPRATDG